MGPPDFVGIGAQKAGTSWWFALLTSHPEIRGPARERKEVNFFEPFWNRPFGEADVVDYHHNFPVQSGTMVGEWTPEYLFDSWTAPCLELAAPAAKLLVLLRDPIERYRSALTHVLVDGRPPSLDDARLAFHRGLYLGQLRHMLKHFPRSQLLVLQYERCVLEPHEQLERTYRFLGVSDPRFAPGRLTRPVNTTEVKKYGLSANDQARLRCAYLQDLHDLVSEFPEIDSELWPSARS